MLSYKEVELGGGKIVMERWNSRVNGIPRCSLKRGDEEKLHGFLIKYVYHKW